MTEYTQEGQPFRIHTKLEDNVLLPESMEGFEALSTPFEFTLDLVSETDDIDGKELLWSDVALEVDLPDGEVRHLHGRIRSFVRRGRTPDLYFYRAQVVPWLWFLSLEQDTRIFDGKSVVEIVTEVFERSGYSDFRFELVDESAYPIHEFTVQYRESNLAFVSRLLEREGIFYFFEHSEDGHTLVLADHMAAVDTCEAQPEARMDTGAEPDEDVILSVDREDRVHTSVVSLRDHNKLSPANLHDVKLETEGNGSGKEGEPEEFYDFPGGFRSWDRGEVLTELALERKEAERVRVTGRSTCRGFVTGTRFTLEGHHLPDEMDREWALVEIVHRAKNASYRGGSGTEGFDYENDFVAIPHDVPFRPPLRTPWPVVKGAHTATVTGPSGEDVHVDKHGRVRVYFHWDRRDTKDDSASLWVPVSQNWAGKNWGGMFIPHVGHEVLVDFVDGDPDQPLITGRLYHTNSPPPQPLPANKYKAIIEDHHGNELVFDTTINSEQIRMYAPTHKSLFIMGEIEEGGFYLSTEKNYVLKIAGDKSETTSGGFSFETDFGFSSKVSVGGSFTFDMGVKAAIKVSSELDIKVSHTMTYSKGKEFKYGNDSKYEHFKKRVAFNSDEEIFLIGGPKDQAVVHGDKKALTLEFGKNPGAKPALVNQPLLWATAASVVGGVALAAAADAWLPDKAKDPVAATVSGLGAIVPCMVGLKQTYGKKPPPKDDPKYPQIHPQTDGRIVVDDQGVLLEGIQKTTPMASIMVSNRSGEITMVGKKLVEVKGAADIKAKAKKSVSIEAPKVDIKKGMFTTKNIKDLG